MHDGFVIVSVLQSISFQITTSIYEPLFLDAQDRVLYPKQGYSFFFISSLIIKKKKNKLNLLKYPCLKKLKQTQPNFLKKFRLGGGRLSLSGYLRVKKKNLFYYKTNLTVVCHYNFFKKNGN